MAKQTQISRKLFRSFGTCAVWKLCVIQQQPRLKMTISTKLRGVDLKMLHWTLPSNKNKFLFDVILYRDRLFCSQSYYVYVHVYLLVIVCSTVLSRVSFVLFYFLRNSLWLNSVDSCRCIQNCNSLQFAYRYFCTFLCIFYFVSAREGTNRGG